MSYTDKYILDDPIVRNPVDDAKVARWIAGHAIDTDDARELLSMVLGDRIELGEVPC